MSGKKRILIVDDNEEFCANLSDILDLKGYRVVIAYDGFQALEMTRESGFDLVLMDVRMPVMDGVETFKKFKEIAPQTPVIMVTAFAVEELIKDALREGAFGSLRKPLDFERLFALIEAALPNGGLVMVVDDDANLCANLQEILVERGYRVSVATDGESAIQRVQEKNFDIIILDLNLPTLNGLETYLAIREFRPGVVVVVITGYADEMSEMVQEIMDNHAYICLEKPLDMDRFIMLLGEVLEKKRDGIDVKRKT
ncbi:MAG: response regulator [Chloroflexota bacterium]|nr:response regulator [Chloroflexota bacterium]